MRLTNTIYKPIVTEKTYAQAARGFYSFKVPMDVTKESVAKEVEKMYGVKVVSVKSSVMPGKNRRIPGTRRYSGRSKWKKIIVKLKDGQTIDIMPKE
ncbi:MAG: 50S ribosomal protein L23 [Patescibacteria group bacterium]|nr:MAG: 50S ribosomal protein L23 [Patescibacteria group bacterium]